MTAPRFARVRRALWTALGWLPVVVLMPVAVAAGALAFADDQVAAHGAQRSGQTTETPIISSRRIATGLANGQTDRALRADLDAFVAGQPPETCLTVEVAGFRYDHRGHDNHIPASLMKILTGYGALEILGPDTTLETTVVVDGPVEDGVLHGNLYLRGGGDPLLVTEDRYAEIAELPGPHTNMGLLADGVAEVGVTAIAGAVIGDAGRYDGEPFHPAWPARYVSQGQSGPVSALTVDGGRPFPGPDEPAARAAHALAESLAAREISVGHGVAAGPAPQDGVVLATAPSAPIRDLVGHILATSDNTTSEALLKEIGFTASGSGSFEAGATAVAEAVATPAGAGPFQVVDGSGLSTDNALSCALVAAVLFDSDHADVLREGLAVAGETGTMRHRWRDHPLAGLVQGKTGSLSSVRALAGYVEAVDGDGDGARFVYIVNGTEPADMTEAVITSPVELAEILARYPNVVDISGLVPGHR